jgi:hypothetical protein
MKGIELEFERERKRLNFNPHTHTNFVRKNPESAKKRFSRKTKVSQYVESAIQHINFPARVDIFDTTLRDGEGTPGVAS